ncbi:MAG: glycosyltransferase family 4 protein [Syntrophomonadaceae bacterium]|jgi:glycosyltransferase involved in cell wall biosynthesis
MSILNIGTYPPKQCGIATFSMDLRDSLTIHGNQVKVMAVSDASYQYNYPVEVVFNIRQQQLQDYIHAANWINSCSEISAIIIQHEYGIYGGEDGDYIIELARLLNKPYIVITHTVLPRPSRHQKSVLNKLCRRAAAIVGMTEKSAQLLTQLYGVRSDLIEVIAHGVPEFTPYPADQLKHQYQLQKRQLISTFGLIGPGKGLELGIEAIAALAPDFPDICYLILGETHPMLKHSEGESYRQMLETMVADLHLEENVKFVNKYLSNDELGQYLYMTDIYLSPYPNRDQAVSGTMAFAIGCGRAIVSTSYAYALEVLREGRGLLASRPDPQELAGLIKEILQDPRLKQRLQERAYELGKTWSWPSVGRQYDCLLKQIITTSKGQGERKINYAGL